MSGGPADTDIGATVSELLREVGRQVAEARSQAIAVEAQRRAEAVHHEREESRLRREVARLQQALRVARSSSETREMPSVGEQVRRAEARGAIMDAMAAKPDPITVAGRFRRSDIGWDVSRFDDRAVRLTIGGSIVIDRDEVLEIYRAFGSFK